MTIAIDLTSLSRPTTGIERYAFEMTTALVLRRSRIRYALLFQNSVPTEFASVGDPFVRCYVSPFESQLLTHQIWLPSIIEAIRPDLVHFPFFGPSPLVRCPHVMNVYDANLWLHPGYLSWKTKVYTQFLLESGLRRAKRIFTTAHFIHGDLQKWAGVRPEQLRCIGAAVAPRFLQKPKDLSSYHGVTSGIRPPFVLAVGTREPRKNIPMLVRSFTQYKERHPLSALSLVIAGRKAWGDKQIRASINQPQHRKAIVLTGYVEDEILQALYASAECLVYPSSYEGFGFPPFEALASGTPVICSDILPLNVLLKDLAIFCSPNDSGSLVAALETVVGNRALKRSAQVLGPREVQKITWESIAQKLEHEYQGISR